MTSSNRIVDSDYGPIIINRHDTHIGRSIERYGYWMQEEIALTISWIARRLQTQPRIRYYDIGANIGTHSLAVASHFRDRVQVRAFEAQQAMFHMLCGTMALNDLHNVSCHHNAVSDLSGLDIAFAVPDYSRENNFGALELVPPLRSDNRSLHRGGFERIRTVSVDSFDERVDFLKIDIEGMELAALRGARQTIAKHRPLVFVETLKCDGDAVAALLLRAAYRIERRSDHIWAIPEA